MPRGAVNGIGQAQTCQHPMEGGVPLPGNEDNTPPMPKIVPRHRTHQWLMTLVLTIPKQPCPNMCMSETPMPSITTFRIVFPMHESTPILRSCRRRIGVLNMLPSECHLYRRAVLRCRTAMISTSCFWSWMASTTRCSGDYALSASSWAWAMISSAR